MNLRGPDVPHVSADSDVNAENNSSAHFPPVGSPAFATWAAHDSVAGHARNALTLLSIAKLADAELSSDPDLIRSIERRLCAIVALCDTRSNKVQCVTKVGEFVRPLGASL